ncbi:hypothetical protein Dda_0622 [Drechslerella dactyloides]|uniref:Uncharacterized protein n=1 Tax=Drechslerella dactyloides TaxID=74499 RepID=A0AAD6NM58_DREDA|nr:hypothetical protein Dda_0622 [Drechslerella dactyloides]
MSSSRSTASLQSLISQALCVHTHSNGGIPDGTAISQTHDRGPKPESSQSTRNSCADTSYSAAAAADVGYGFTPSPNDLRSSSIRVSQHRRPSGTVTDAAPSETSAVDTPLHAQSNINTQSQSCLRNRERERSLPAQFVATSSCHDDVHVHVHVHVQGGPLLLSHTSFSASDVPVPGGYEAAVSLPIALFIPPRHIPELRFFPTPPPPPSRPSDADSNLRSEAGPEDESRYPYAVGRYLAESYAEDPYPMRSRLHLR